MTTTKMTKMDMFKAVVEVLDSLEVAAMETEVPVSELIAGINHEIELLKAKAAKAKSGTSKAALAKAEEQQDLMNEMVAVMGDAESAMTATEIGNAVGVSVQKASALLKKLVDEGTVVKTVDKKKTFFSLADNAE